jgi:uncharacterized protein YybS (DUF2232 family)
VVLSNEGKGISLRDFLAGVVISSLFLIFSGMSPLSASLLLFIAPLPIFFYYTKLGRNHGLVLVIATLLISFSTLEALNRGAYVPLLCLFTSLGVILAEIVKKKVSIEITILASVAVFTIPLLVLIAYLTIKAGEAPWRLMEPYMVNAILESVQHYSEMGVPTEQVTLLKDNARKIAVFFIRILPALGIVIIALCSGLNLLAARMIFNRRNLDFPDFGDLAGWKSPEKLVWILISSGTMLLIPDDRFHSVGLNLLIICLFVYLLHGLAIVSFFFRKKNVPVFLRTLFYVLLIFQQMFILPVIAAGLFDLWIDFRKFNKKTSDSAA